MAALNFIICFGIVFSFNDWVPFLMLTILQSGLNTLYGHWTRDICIHIWFHWLDTFLDTNHFTEWTGCFWCNTNGNKDMSQDSDKSVCSQHLIIPLVWNRFDQQNNHRKSKVIGQFSTLPKTSWILSFYVLKIKIQNVPRN